MHARRKEDLSLYRKKALSFITYEKETIETFNYLCSSRNITVDDDTRFFLNFFEQEEYLHHGSSLIYLVEASAICTSKWGAVSSANVFEFTLYRFRTYGKVLKERLHENEQ